VKAARQHFRVLGLDPGLRHTGWGVIDVRGNRLSHVADGVIAPRGDAPTAERLVEIFRGVGSIIERFAPDQAAVEETFVNKNATTTLKLGLARGVVLLAPAERGLTVAEYAANLIKKSVVGVGHAEKAQVQMMVRRLLPGCLTENADAADALAVAICHAHHAQTGMTWEAATIARSPYAAPPRGEGTTKPTSAEAGRVRRLRTIGAPR
jgi:crossover junction endodeoxyribonuclease RuvC